MDFLRQLWNGIQEAWQQLSLSARVNIAAFAVASTLLILFVAYSGARTTYRVVGMNVPPADLIQAESLLEQAGISYKISDTGRDLLVAEGSIRQAETVLLTNQITFERRKDPSFEMFDDMGIMSDRTLLGINKERAVNGRIQEMLDTLDFVNYSMVTITRADDKLFAPEQKPSTASVVLNLKRNAGSLSPKTIEGIANLVANAGDIHLNKDNILIKDTEGHVLHEPLEEGFSSLANNMLEHQRMCEAGAQAKIEGALQEIGLRSVVLVSAKMNRNEETVEKHELGESAPLSEMTQEAEIKNIERTPEGAPGAVANQPEGTVTPGGLESTETTTEELTNNEVGYTDSSTFKPAGNVLAYTVTVGVAPKTVDAEGDADAVTDWSEEELNAIKQIAMAAVGDSTEDSVVTVSQVDFGPSPAEIQLAQMGAIPAMGQWRSSVTLLLQVIALLAVFILMRSFFRKAIEVPVIEEEEEVIVDVPEATKEDMRRQDINREIVDMALDNPDVVAQLLRSWMTEQDD